MTWPFSRKFREASPELREAREARDEASQRQSEAEWLARQTREMRRQNHFGQSIAAALEGKPDGNYRGKHT